MEKMSSHKKSALRYVEVETVGTVCSISIDGAMARHIGLRHNRRHIERVFFRRLREFAVVQREGLSHRIQLAGAALNHEFLRSLREIDRELNVIAKKPLGPAVVEKILGISKNERRRWTGDGRLRQQGQAFLKRGQLVAFPTYAPAHIDELLSDPSRISAWRAADLKTTQASTRKDHDESAF